MKIKFIQKAIDKIRGKKVFKDGEFIYEIDLPKTTRQIKQTTIVAVSGFYFSGSSVVSDILSEFKFSKMFAFQEVYSTSSK